MALAIYRRFHKRLGGRPLTHFPEVPVDPPGPNNSLDDRLSRRAWESRPYVITRANGDTRSCLGRGSLSVLQSLPWLPQIARQVIMSEKMWCLLTVPPRKRGLSRVDQPRGIIPTALDSSLPHQTARGRAR
jgi:hypothetical protein